MAFPKGGFVITTALRHVGKANITQAKLTEVARVLGIDLPPTENIKTIVAFGEIDPKDNVR
jgi:hypothetical protein